MSFISVSFLPAVGREPVVKVYQLSDNGGLIYRREFVRAQAVEHNAGCVCLNVQAVPFAFFARPDFQLVNVLSNAKPVTERAGGYEKAEFVFDTGFPSWRTAIFAFCTWCNR